jgi:hypothetical protein
MLNIINLPYASPLRQVNVPALYDELLPRSPVSRSYFSPVSPLCYPYISPISPGAALAG